MAFLISGILDEEKHEKTLNSGPLCGIEMVSRFLHMLNRHLTCLFPIWHMLCLKNKYLGTQEPPHCLLPVTLCPSFGEGRNWMKQEMVGLYALVLLWECVVCVCVCLLTITLFSLGFCLCKVSISQTPFSLNLWVPFNITTLNSCHLFSLNCQGTLIGPSCLFLVSLNQCHHAM